MAGYAYLADIVFAMSAASNRAKVLALARKWKYLFRAVYKHGRLIDFMLSDRRNTRATRRFLSKALTTMRHWPPSSITTDQPASYLKAIS